MWIRPRKTKCRRSQIPSVWRTFSKRFSSFQIVFRPYENAQPAFSNSSGLKSVLKRFRFHDRLRMDGRPNQRSKAAFLRCSVWGLKYSGSRKNMRYSSWVCDCGFLDYYFLSIFLLVSSFSTGDLRMFYFCIHYTAAGTDEIKILFFWEEVISPRHLWTGKILLFYIDFQSFSASHSTFIAVWQFRGDALFMQTQE